MFLWLLIFSSNVGILLTFELIGMSSRFAQEECPRWMCETSTYQLQHACTGFSCFGYAILKHLGSGFSFLLLMCEEAYLVLEQYQLWMKHLTIERAHIETAQLKTDKLRLDSLMEMKGCSSLVRQQV
ncbi:hypothetical protein M5689_025463 [Euphorbia peplus]|nr:hypothetical protein M5689_025463 [Euphorbia peplus]